MLTCLECGRNLYRNTAQLPLRKRQRRPPWGQERPVRKVLHYRLGGVGRSTGNRKETKQVLDGVSLRAMRAVLCTIARLFQRLRGEHVRLMKYRAVWTRFHPLGYKVQELLFSGKLGKVKRFSADFSMAGDLDSQSHFFGMIALGGGGGGGVVYSWDPTKNCLKRTKKDDICFKIN